MIYIVYGTRAELIKFSSLIRELKKRRVQFRTVDTGQHDNKSLNVSLGLPKPDFHLGKSYRDRWSKLEASFVTYPLASLMALVWGFGVFLKLARILSKGDVIVTHGNAMGVPLAIISTKVGKITKTNKSYKIVHMESGFRGNTRSTKLLDTIYKFADKSSDILFTPFKSTQKNLHNTDGKVILSGDVMKDVVKETMKIKTWTKKIKKDYVLANITRSVVTKQDALHMLHAMEDSPIDVIFIINPVIRKRVEKFGLNKMLKSKRIILMQPTDYPKFLHLLKNSKGCITDSTGVQEECAVLGKPCIVTNDFVQIPELAESGVVKKTGCNYIGILGGLRKIGNGRWKITSKDIMGSGSPTKKIADHLVSLERSSR